MSGRRPIRVQLLDDATGFLAGVAQTDELSLRHTPRSRAFFGGVLARDDVSNGSFQITHEP